MPSLLNVKDVTKTYQSGDAPLEVLSGVSFEVNPGEMVAVVGESGSGKSTLLHLLGALDRPTQGEVYFEGINIFKKSDVDLAAFRNRQIGFVFQFHHLLPEFTALENVAMPALIQGAPQDATWKRGEELLNMLGLGARLTHRPDELSGGEKQRVAVARALMNQPGLVLADEPTGNLDQKTADALHDDLLRLSREQNQSFIIVTHNPSLAKQADRVLQLVDGRIEEK